MKSLPMLLKLARQNLDAVRRLLTDQMKKIDHVDEKLALQAQTVLAEQKAAAATYELTRAYGGYAGAARAQREKLEAERAELVADADNLRAAVEQAHVEVRKFERLLELQKERAEAEALKRENAELDEMTVLRRRLGHNLA